MHFIFVTRIIKFSAWIDDKNVLPYLDHKEQMVKLGKPKNTFDKAIIEIENYMTNPDVSFTLQHNLT